MKQIIDPDRYRLGFELETESFHGFRWGQRVRAEERIDVIRMRRDQEIRRAFYWARCNVTYQSSPDNTHYSRPAGIAQEIRPLGEEAYQSFLQHMRQSCESYISHYIAQSAYATGREHEMTGSKFQELITHPSFRVERDGTVSGPEIITTAGFTIQETKNLSRTIFTHPMCVSTRCSFHIHLSVNGIEHQPGYAMPMFMMMHLLANIHRIPSSVLTRWIEMDVDNKMQYFIPNPKTDDDTRNRYNFIAWRSREGNKPATWEFRCWGNIDNAMDAHTVIELTVEAYEYAHHQVVNLRRNNTRDRGAFKEALLSRTKDELNARQRRGAANG